MEVEKAIEKKSNISSPRYDSGNVETLSNVVVHASSPLPLPFGIEEKSDEVIFVDPCCGEGKRILADSDTTVSELFAVLRQFVSPVCNNIDLIVNEMLRRGVGPNDIDATTGLTMIHYVIRAESVCSRFDYGTSLHIASACLSVDVAELLIAHGANINLKDDKGRIPESCFPSNIHAEDIFKADKIRRLLNDIKCDTSKSAKLLENKLSKSPRDSLSRRLTTSNCGFSVGDHVVVGGSNSGVIRFLGNTQFASGLWCGIELNEPIGRNDGSINGIRYFRCPPINGVFAQPNKLRIKN